MMQQVIAELNAVKSKGVVLGLDATLSLLKNLGNPHEGLKYIHVAGTNGKGSVCAMITAILQSAGYSVGLYTSPHLVRFNERIRVNGEEISDDEIVKLWGELRDYRDKNTYFELVTAMAFLYFKEKNVDYVVLETGLGGRLDATNVVMPVMSVITNVSIDHKRFLGEAIQDIAKEKAGVIKENVPLVTGCSGEALEIIKQVCSEKGSELVVVENSGYKTNLAGSFQQKNVDLAVAVAKQMGVSEEQIKKGLMEVDWQGRMQYIKPNVLVDVGHNAAAAELLGRELDNMSFKNLILVFGVLKDKDYKSMLANLVPKSAFVVLCKPKSDRAMEPERLKELVDKESIVVEDPYEALLEAEKRAADEDLILVTGSHYVVGEVIKTFK